MKEIYPAEFFKDRMVAPDRELELNRQLDRLRLVLLNSPFIMDGEELIYQVKASDINHLL